MSPLIRRVGLILARRNVGSTDRRIVVLASDGKHELRARGTQKLQSKLAGSLEPLTLVELTSVNGRAGELVTGSAIRDAFPSIRANVARIAGAGLVAVAADSLIRGHLDEATSYRCVRETFALLGVSRTNREVLVAVAYGLWSLLRSLGYAPRPEGIEGTPPVRRTVAIILRGDPRFVRRIRCRVGTARQACEAAMTAVTMAAERPLPAAAFFRRATSSVVH